MKDSSIATLRLGASMILGTLIFIAAMNVHAVAGAAHAITIGVMGFLALVVVNLRD